MMHVWDFERWQRKAISRRSMNEVIYVLYVIPFEEPRGPKTIGNDARYTIPTTTHDHVYRIAWCSPLSVRIYPRASPD